MVSRRCTFIYTPAYYCDIGPHVFPMEKFARVHQALREDGDIPAECFLEPDPASAEDMRLVHTEAYLNDLLGYRHTARTFTSELPISEEIVRAYFLAAGGSILAGRRALEDGASMNLTGGFHHAFPDRAEGFCYINDVAVAIRKLQSERRLRRAVVVDCDLHQGNGTAFIFHDDPSVFTFSIHQENNYPAKRRSDLDLGLRDGTGDDEYIGLLEQHVPRILDEHRPELVAYVAGADPYREDLLGGLALTLDGLRRRDECVVRHCRARGIPLFGVLAGGYAADLEDTVRIHHATCRLAWETGGRQSEESG